ncbi:CCA tRNA nucleotidyltransferase [Synechocystis sp. PCC 6714]|uniref:CCA tRNA nucleotidyltransferase n=1 Tax=Synechocystis sp. (strain PCC 6714) TaxID=1147 RepID=UPI0004151A32|nr:CCA tRNA nucleotidyltransferase [Synechocystis sp. PCC 6714]AIE73506.1 tRNA nucleotidyltransferase, CC-adding [Synechocystis sp. PCC 6714]MCT0254145.1 CCA tRNA nucleotidyltransferase [Synechocystis sp. CS-94]
MLCPVSHLADLRQQVPFDLALLPPQACLVGGAVRDALLGRRREYLDWDFVVPNGAIEAASAIASRYRAGFVVLDKARHIARVVFTHGTVDFAQQEGMSLEQDLARRDFTVNAIAYNFQQNKLIDPMAGVGDLQRGQLKMVAAANLADDPLRLLRAYRQAAQLQFALDPDTRTVLRELAPRIKTVAAERVQAEFNYLLGSPRGSQWLLAAWQDGMLAHWFPHANLSSLNAIGCIDLAIAAIKNQLTLLERQQFFQALGKKGIAIAKLASLVDADIKTAEAELQKLKYSRHELRSVQAILQAYPQLSCLEASPTLRQLYFFFAELGKYLPHFVLYALAHSPHDYHSFIFELLTHFLDPGDRLAHPQPLITGKDLIEQLQIKPSPLIGQLLTEIHIAHIEGKIKTGQEALAYAQELGKC